MVCKSSAWAVAVIALGGCAQIFGIANTSEPPIDASPDAPPGCGDGIIVSGEPCNGSNLGGNSCATAVAPGWAGSLSCTATCSLDTAGCAPPPTTWNTFGSAANWSSFDVSTLFAGAKGFSSSVFDGRYLYLVPNGASAASGLIARYDTQGSLGASASWMSFDLTTVNPKALGFEGGAFDGRYVYLVPYNNGAFDGVAVRLDTKAAGGFSAAASWTTFDIATVNPGAVGFVRAAFDGRYVYYTPFQSATNVFHGIVARYDTEATGGFGSAASWTTFDVSTVNAGAKGFLGSVFDGRYVYLVPYYNNAAYDGIVARYDTHAAGGFGSAASWTTFDMVSLNANAVGFYTAVFDGRYMYFGQHYDGVGTAPNYGGLVMRYDTTAAGGLGSAASWASFDTSTLPGGPRGYDGSVFDGRYIYFSPYYNGAAYIGVVSRYDTTAVFGSAASWETFNAATLNAAAVGFDGTGFDGQQVYMIPHFNGAPQGVLVRFDAKTASWLPKGWNNFFE